MGVVQDSFGILMLFVLFAPFLHVLASNHPRFITKCLTLPPAVRLGLGQEHALKKDCELASSGACFWEINANEGYELATRIFQELNNGKTGQIRSKTLWFPTLESAAILEGLATVIVANSDKLGGVHVATASWPQVPATKLELSWRHMTAENELTLSGAQQQRKISATERWVTGTLCRLKLCPHTVSLQRGAVGLELAKVREGPVIVRHAQSGIGYPCRAASAASAFWECVSQIATTPEDELSTVLLVVPSSYDDSFLDFADLCDNLIEPSVKISGADSVIGRAWFHPKYEAAAIGHDKVLPGHALPASMVNGFINAMSSETTKLPDPYEIARANDAVRWTPHSTINLLRRSQLNAAKQVEAHLANSKPNAIYAKNVFRILADGSLLKTKKTS